MGIYGKYLNALNVSKFWVFWSVYSRIRTEYRDLLCVYLLCKSPYSVQIQQNTDQKNSEFADFSYCDISEQICLWFFFFFTIHCVVYKTSNAKSKNLRTLLNYSSLSPENVRTFMRLCWLNWHTSLSLES